MVRYRRFPYEPFEENQALLNSARLPAAGLSFVQQLRLHLNADRARSRRSPYAAVVCGHTTLCWLDTNEDRMMTCAPAPVAVSQLQQQLVEQHQALRLILVEHNVFSERAVVSSNVPLRPTLWDIGLRAAREGAPVPQLQASTQLQLSRWPDFRILAHRPDHFRLCALLVKQGASVQACCDALGMPSHQVQSFFNAAFLTGYAFPVAGKEVPVRTSPADGLVNLWRQLRIRWSA